MQKEGKVSDTSLRFKHHASPLQMETGTLAEPPDPLVELRAHIIMGFQDLSINKVISGSSPFNEQTKITTFGAQNDILTEF